RIENATKNLTVMPYSKYFLLYQANSTFVDFEIEGKTTRKIRKNAERGTWYYDFIPTPEYPKKLIVHNNSITMLAFIPYEIGANWVQEFTVNAERNTTATIQFPEFHMGFRCLSATASINMDTTATYYRVFVYAGSSPIFFAQKDSNGIEWRQFHDFSSELNQAILGNQKNLTLTVNISSTAPLGSLRL
ncbi:MAG: hypothetical protein ACP5JR_03895, partial [Thermoplasmata archaeon]